MEVQYFYSNPPTQVHRLSTSQMLTLPRPMRGPSKSNYFLVYLAPHYGHQLLGAAISLATSHSIHRVQIVVILLSECSVHARLGFE